MTTAKPTAVDEQPPKQAIAVTGSGVHVAIMKIIQSLAKTGISKDKNNAQQGYKFRGIDDVYNALAPLLGEFGLVIIPKVIERLCEARQTKSGGVLYSVTLKVDFHFIATEDGTAEIITMYGEAMDSGDKATNKALSAAYKYACLQAFCIPTEGEDDADKTTHEETVAPTGGMVAKPLLGTAPSQQSSVESYKEHKQEYAIAAPIMPDGTLNYDAFGADLEIALQGAKTMHDVSMLKKANAKILNAMKAERPEMFEFLKDLFAKTSTPLA